MVLSKEQKPAESSLDQLAEEAQAAIENIQSGGDLQAAILRSYAEMNRLVKEELGFARNRAMTARDFEDYLDSKGLPAVPLRTLTRLFEQARYGSFAPGIEEETAAIACLTELIEAIQALKGANEIRTHQFTPSAINCIRNAHLWVMAIFSGTSQRQYCAAALPLHHYPALWN